MANYLQRVAAAGASTRPAVQPAVRVPARLPGRPALARPAAQGPRHTGRRAPDPDVPKPGVKTVAGAVASGSAHPPVPGGARQPPAALPSIAPHIEPVRMLSLPRAAGLERRAAERHFAAPPPEIAGGSDYANTQPLPDRPEKPATGHETESVPGAAQHPARPGTLRPEADVPPNPAIAGSDMAPASHAAVRAREEQKAAPRQEPPRRPQSGVEAAEARVVPPQRVRSNAGPVTNNVPMPAISPAAQALSFPFAQARRTADVKVAIGRIDVQVNNRLPLPPPPVRESAPRTDTESSWETRHLSWFSIRP